MLPLALVRERSDRPWGPPGRSRFLAAGLAVGLALAVAAAAAVRARARR